jgi:3-hydroxybutyryl-CoA dehydrogenase
MMKTGIIGCGAMGAGIAQVAAQAGANVVVTDANHAALEKAKLSLETTLRTLEEKGKLRAGEAQSIISRIYFVDSIHAFAGCDWVVEAIVEKLEAKQAVLREAEQIVRPDCVLGTNTSSLSVTAIASACQRPQRVAGIHFFNPAPLMPLVEVIPALQTSPELPGEISTVLRSWSKVPVVARDTPGFIVNRVARPYYGEALRIFEEGLADMPTIDEAMRKMGFRMGPFELMDLIGNDVNYMVTESVFQSTYFDPRYRPAITQKRMTEAGWLGRKTGRGYYDYQSGAPKPTPSDNEALLSDIGQRIVLMLINEACDALYHGIANKEDLELAMTKGVNYPKGLFAWGEEIGWNTCAATMERLYVHYGEDRYRMSPGMRKFISAS